MTTDHPSDSNDAWVARWVQYGPELERIGRDSLREFRYEEHLPAIDALLEIGVHSAEPRRTSGLVEQQRLFRKLRRESDTEKSP